MRNLGIHARLLLVALFLIVAVVMVVVFVGLHTTKQFIMIRFEDRMEFLAKYLALNSELGVLVRDTDRLEKLATNLLTEEDVIRVTIIDDKGHKLVDVGESIPDSCKFVEKPVLFKTNSANLLFGSKKSLFKSETHRIGLVQLFYSTKGIDQLLETISLQYVMSSMIVMVISVVLFYFMSRSLVKQITALASTARKVGEGQLDLRAIPGDLPETRELALAFNSMLDSISEKRKALIKANQEVVRQKALAEIGKFSLMVAHEVKNPLGIIKSSLEVLKADHQISSSDPMIVYIEDEISRLNKLIESFLIFARPQEIKLQTVDLNELSRDVAARAAYLESNGMIQLHEEIPEEQCFAKVDPELLTSALWNILKNSCEATEGKGNVWMRVHSDGSFWSIEIEDDGDGVPKEIREKIFEPFFTTKAKGTGLGLAFASEVVEAHGGKIRVEDGRTKGALFVVTIPCNNVLQSVSEE